MYNNKFFFKVIRIQTLPNQPFIVSGRRGVSNVACDSKKSAPAVQYRITETIILIKCRMPNGTYGDVR